MREFLTSQRCPKCGGKVKIVDYTRWRVLNCEFCKIFYHRDTMAAENTGNRLHSLIHHGVDPEYLNYLLDEDEGEEEV